MYVSRVPVVAVDAVVASAFSLLSLFLNEFLRLHKKNLFHRCTTRQRPLLRGPRGVPSWERSIGGVVPFLVGNIAVDEVVVVVVVVLRSKRARHRRRHRIRKKKNDIIIIIRSTCSPRPHRRTKPSSAPRAFRNSSSKPSEKPSLCAGRDWRRTPSPPPSRPRSWSTFCKNHRLWKARSWRRRATCA